MYFKAFSARFLIFLQMFVIQLTWWVFKIFIFICFFSAKVTCEFLANKKQRRNYNKFKHFSRKTTVFSTFLIRLSFQGYLCKSGIAIFALRFTWNYAYSPFERYRRISASKRCKFSHLPSLNKSAVPIFQFSDENQNQDNFNSFTQTKVWIKPGTL